MRQRISTGRLAVVAAVFVAITWLVAANFIRVEVRLFGAEIAIRLGWALAIALVAGAGIGAWLASGRRRP